MTKQAQSHKICIPDSVINSFCYPFAKALFLKLQALEKEDRIFKEGISKAQEGGYDDLTSIANSVSESLSKQIKFNISLSLCTLEDFQKFIKLAEEFLAIFEIK